jgi:predicted Zn-dependent peptidase
MTWIGENLVAGRPIEPLSTLQQKILNVTAADVRSTARTLLNTSGIKLALVSPQRRPASLLKQLHM